MDTDEIPGFFLFLKNHIFIARSEGTTFTLSFTCEDIGVAMVTNMISQLQESFPLRLLSIIALTVIAKACDQTGKNSIT